MASNTQTERRPTSFRTTVASLRPFFSRSISVSANRRGIDRHAGVPVASVDGNQQQLAVGPLPPSLIADF